MPAAVHAGSPVTRLVVSAAGAEVFAAEAARELAEAIRAAVGARERCSLALAGGETPRGAYERLAGMPDVP